MFPLIVFMVIAIALTFILIRMNSTCNMSIKESFVGENTAPNTCPVGTARYYDAKDNILCCDGQVVGTECMGKSVCRISPMTDPNAPPYCSDYMAAATFNLKNSQIQNPDTGLCLGVDRAGKTVGNLIVGQKCTVDDLWTKTEIGQIKHGKTGKCLARSMQGIGYVYTLDTCNPKPEQIFTYDYKNNTITSKAPDATPVYLQDFASNPRVNLFLEKMTYDQFKKFVTEKMKFSLTDSTLQTYYKVYHGDENKPARSTFLSVQPGQTDFALMVNQIFKK